MCIRDSSNVDVPIGIQGGRGNGSRSRCVAPNFRSGGIASSCRIKGDDVARGVVCNVKKVPGGIKSRGYSGCIETGGKIPKNVRCPRSVGLKSYDAVVSGYENRSGCRVYGRTANGTGAGMRIAPIIRTVGVERPGCSCLLYTSPSPRDATLSRMPSSA